MKRYRETGSHHLVLVVVIVVALIGVLGFIGYNSWQKNVSNAGGASTLGVKNKKASVTLWPKDFQYLNKAKVVRSGGAQVIKISSPKRGNSSVSPQAYTTPRGDKKYDLPNGTPSPKLVQFVKGNFSKPVQICATAKGIYKSLAPDLYLEAVNIGAHSATKSKDFHMTKKYKEYCYKFTLVSKTAYNSTNTNAFAAAIQLFSNYYDSGDIYVKKVVITVQ